MHALTIKTRLNEWVIPYDCELLKALLNTQNLRAQDLVFNSSVDCQRFIHDLALLATRDELDCGIPSPLTPLTRELFALQSNSSQLNKSLTSIGTTAA